MLKLLHSPRESVSLFHDPTSMQRGKALCPIFVLMFRSMLKLNAYSIKIVITSAQPLLNQAIIFLQNRTVRVRHSDLAV